MRPFIVVSGFIVASVFTACMLWAGTIYEYTDKDGSVMLTDNPPPGVNAKPVQKFQDMTDAERQALQQEKASSMQKYEEADTKRQEKEEKIRIARKEYEQALENEQRYRSNRNQSGNYSQQRHWNLMLQEVAKEIAQKKKKLDKLEQEP
jgi:hypothetical protein